MRGNRVYAVLGVAAGLGLIAAILVWQVLQRPVTAQASERPTELIEVVAASVDLPVGTLIAEEQLTTVGVSADQAPPGSFTDKQQVVGRGIVVPLVARETVLESKLAPVGAGAGLPTVIPEGMRAVSVKVDEVVGVAGFVLPGTRVDVLVTVENGDAANELSVTKLVLQNIQVLAAGESIQQDAEGKPQKVTVITLLVTPEDAEKLTLAATEGHIQLALRNVMDRDSVSTEGSDMRSLVTERQPVVIVRETKRIVRNPAPAPTTQVEMYRGTEKAVETFAKPAQP